MTGWKAPPGWRKLRAKVFATKGRQCWWGCGRTATTVDHVVPVAIGGGHELSNLVPSCGRCNYSRGASFGNRMRGQAATPGTWASSRRW
jgi:5-methylcytosine-specific restriction endonuclease McrA